MTRRQSLIALAGGIACVSRSRAADSAPTYKDYFGDLHNHNNVGYALGSLERSFEIAHDHLDFYAFTPHAWWHDIGKYDLHNHNNVGYALGSLERSFEIAHDHLDFYAFTPHAWWHDIGKYDLHIEDK